MLPTIDLAPGTEENSLAQSIVEKLRAHLALPRKASLLRGIRGAVLLVSEDTIESITLRFDHGRVTIHDGQVGVPSVTLCGPLSSIETCARIRKLDSDWTSPLRNPALRSTFGDLWSGKLTIYGFLAHPRLVWRLLRVLAI